MILRLGLIVWTVTVLLGVILISPIFIEPQTLSLYTHYLGICSCLLSFIWTIFWHSFHGLYLRVVCSFVIEVCLCSGSLVISTDFRDIDWSFGESKIIFVMRLRRIPSGWGRCGQIFAEDISSTLLIFNTSLHLHQIALRPECSKQTTSPNLPFCHPSLPHPVLLPLLSSAISLSVWWPIHRGAYRHEQ